MPFIQVLKIESVEKPPLGFVPRGSKFPLPVKVRNLRPFRTLSGHVQIVDTLPDGRTVTIGELSARFPPGVSDHKVDVTMPDVIGIDKVQVKLHWIAFMFFSRLQDTVSFTVEKVTG